MANPTQITLTDAVHLDAALNSINSYLTTDLTWLDTAWRNAEAMEREGMVTPLIFVSEGNNEQYISLYPDDLQGNYCFWHKTGPDRILEANANWYTAQTDIDLIFFFQFRDVYTSDHLTKTIENVKADILASLTQTMYPKFIINTITTEPRKVWDKFNIKGVKPIYQLRPYGQIKFTGTITYKTASC